MLPPPVDEEDELELDELELLPMVQNASNSGLKVWSDATVVSQLAGSTSPITAIWP